MTNPYNINQAAIAQAIEQLKASLPGNPRDYMAHQAPGALVHTTEESLRLHAKLSERLSENPIFPITSNIANKDINGTPVQCIVAWPAERHFEVKTTQEDDGSLTIRVVPSTTP